MPWQSNHKFGNSLTAQEGKPATAVALVARNAQPQAVVTAIKSGGKA
jgi:hypothetical protein